MSYDGSYYHEGMAVDGRTQEVVGALNHHHKLSIMSGLWSAWLENVNLGSLEFNTKDNINTWGGLMLWECLSVSCTYYPILLPTSCGCLEMVQRFYSEQHCFLLDTRVLYCSPVAPSPSYPGLTGNSSEGRECYAAPGSLWSGWRYPPDE